MIFALFILTVLATFFASAGLFNGRDKTDGIFLGAGTTVLILLCIFAIYLQTVYQDWKPVIDHIK